MGVKNSKSMIRKGMKYLSQWDFIYVGSLIPIKNLRLLIEAFSRVVKKNQSVRLCLLGKEKEEIGTSK